MKTFFTKIKEDILIFRNKEILSIIDYIHLLNPRLYPVILVRISSSLYEHKLGFLAKIISMINFTLFGCDIARAAKIDGGLYLPHTSGIVIGEYVTIGKNCVILQGVTLGDRGEEYEISNPIIGDYVEIGAGVKVLGQISIGDFARIGANSVVLNDVPKCGIAVGLPAEVIKYRDII